MKVVKIVKSVSLNPAVTGDAITKAQFYGYRSLSDLVEDLLRGWVRCPVKKVAA